MTKTKSQKMTQISNHKKYDLEANEALGKKDFILRARISRKESKETRYWLQLLTTGNNDQEKKRLKLSDECTELLKILSSILEKTK